jgi:cob(I)alamin adenosyltransferase
MAKPKEWKIYTRKGDKGETSLIGGSRVPKFDLRIECYGTVDELNSVVGMLRDLSDCEYCKDTLLEIQDRLFTIESHLAADSEKAILELPGLNQKDIVFLEKEIDRMNEGLAELTHFILPGGHIAVSWAHIARTVCRRAERHIIKLSTQAEVESLILQYINRLSDYFFVLARRLAFDLKVAENQWKARR